MKVLQVISFFPPAWAWGGPVRTAYELSKGLVKRGYEVTVYTTDSLDSNRRVNLPRSKPVDLEGIEVYYFRSLSNWLAGKHRIKLTPGIIKAAHDNVKEFDIIHLHGYRTPQNIVIYHYAKKYGVPYVLHSQGTLPKVPPKRALKAIYDLLWGNGLTKCASRVIAMTSMEAEQFKNMGVSGEKIAVIPTAIDLADFTDLPSRCRFRERYNISDHDRLILYLGRVHQSKGIDLLVRAFARLLGKLDKVKLAIAGPDDGYLSPLRTLIKDLQIDSGNILLTGPLYEKDKIEAYVDADVFVLPSAFEPYGLVLLEACACGTPVIFSKNGGLADVLDAQGGLAISYDESDLLNALLRILSDDEMRREFGQRGKSLVHEQFGVSKMVDQLEQLYLTCLEGRFCK